MKREDIIRMAQEAELLRGGENWTEPYRWGVSQIEHFAELVAEAEREACAQVCEARFMGDLNREDQEARRCAEAIRKRGDE